MSEREDQRAMMQILKTGQEITLRKVCILILRRSVKVAGRRSAERNGTPVSMADGQIAAICHTHGATLATRNTKDFEPLGIPLINPWVS